jgi:hypothetical protein
MLMSLGVAVFVSCAERPPPPPAQPVAMAPLPQPLPVPSKQRAFPLPTRKPSPPPENVANLSEPGGGEAAVLATPEPQPPALDRAHLIGLDEPAARRLLGAATEQSEAPPANIWRYRTANCELDLFFYLNLRSGKMRTLHYVFKDDHAGSEDCLRSVIAARSN